MSQYSDWYARKMADIAEGERIQEQKLKEAREARLFAAAQLQANLDQKKYDLDEKKYLLEQQKALAQKEKETRDLEKEVAASQVVNFIQSMNPSDRDFPQKLRNLSITNSQIRAVLSDPVMGKYLKENYIKPAEEAHWNAWKPLQEMANEAGAVVDVRKIAPIKDDGTPDGEAFLSQLKPMKEAMIKARQKAEAEELARQQALVARAVKTPGIESVEKTAGGEFVIKSGQTPSEKQAAAMERIREAGKYKGLGMFDLSGNQIQPTNQPSGSTQSAQDGSSQILTPPTTIDISSPIGVAAPVKEMDGEVSLPVESVPATTEEPKRKSLGEIF